MHNISLSLRPVGTHFGLVGVCRVGERSAESPVVPAGNDGVAKQRAYEAALSAGLLREIGEAHDPELLAPICRRVGCTILQGHVVVAGDDRRPDAQIASDIELLIERL